MSLPPISPTGAMASGDYVDYMIGYLGPAMDSMNDQLAHYIGTVKSTDWNTLWLRTINSMNSTVTTLGTDVSKLKAQVQMADDAIARL